MRSLSGIDVPGNDADAIQLSLLDDPGKTIREIIRENLGKTFMLGIPLIATDCEIVRQRGTIFSGIVAPGMLHLAPPNHRWQKLLKGPWKSIRLSIPAPLFFDLLRDRRTQNKNKHVHHFDRVMPPHAQIQMISRSIMPALSLDPSNRSLFLDGIVRSLLAFLFHEYQTNDARRLSSMVLSKVDLERCISFAHAHMGSALHLNEWSQSIGISESEFSKRFRATTGSSPYRWFLDRRLERAQELILAGNMSLSEIALSVGYSSQSHLTGAFKRSTGLSPIRWKQSRQR